MESKQVNNTFLGYLANTLVSFLVICVPDTKQRKKLQLILCGFCLLLLCFGQDVFLSVTMCVSDAFQITASSHGAIYLLLSTDPDTFTLCE